MKESIITLCSLAICLWSYQIGLWQLAIPMVIALEARNFIKRRWKISWKNFQLLHILGAFLWLLSIFYIPALSPSPIPYTAISLILQCLPIGFFPLVVAQIYCTNFTSLYRAFSRSAYQLGKDVNLFYPYFGICLFAASVTGGNTLLFLTITVLLISGLLGGLRSQRFSAGVFYLLIVLAFMLSLMGSHQLTWLQANLKFNRPDIFKPLIEHIASLSSNHHKDIRQPNSNTDLFKKAALNKGLQQIESTVTKAGTPPNSVSLPISSVLPKGAESLPSLNPAPEGVAVPEGSQPSPGSVPSVKGGDPQNAASIASTVQTATGNPSPSLTQSPQGSGATSIHNATQGSSPSPSITPSSRNANPIHSSQNISQSDGQNGGQNRLGSTMASSQGVVLPTEGAESNSATASTQNPNPQKHKTNSPNPTPLLPESNQNQAQTNAASSFPSLIQGAGERVDPQQSQTQIGNAGALQMSKDILFRVAPKGGLTSNQPAFPLYIREATYNQYRSGSWNAVQPGSVSQASPSKGRWTLGSQTATATSVRISANLRQPEGLLKLPIGTSTIDNLGVDTLQINQYGTVSIKGKPKKIEYTVQFDASRSLDSPPTQADREIPQAERAAMQTVLQSLNLTGKSDPDIVNAIAAFFSKGFQYSLNLSQAPKNVTPLSAFLLNHRSGHCEYFASATSLLLRLAGIPTRYAVGYAVSEYSPAEQLYIVRAQDAHAWVLAYVSGSWITVDTTPGGGQAEARNVDTALETTPSQGQKINAVPEPAASQKQKVNTLTNSQNKSNITGKKNNNTKANQSSSAKDTQPFSMVESVKALPKKISEARSFIASQISKKINPVLGAAIIIGLGLIIILISVFVVWRMVKRRHDAQHSRRRGFASDVKQDLTPGGLDSEFYMIENQLRAWGLERKSSETFKQWILRLKQKIPESNMNNLNQIIDLHYRYRFDPQGIATDDRAKLKSMIQTWLIETKA